MGGYKTQTSESDFDLVYCYADQGEANTKSGHWPGYFAHRDYQFHHLDHLNPLIAV